MKNSIKLLISFLAGGLLFGSIGVFASTLLASDISFEPNDKNWNVHNVQ